MGVGGDGDEEGTRGVLRYLLIAFGWSWLVNSSRSSILVAVLFHCFLNTAARIFPDPTANLFYWIVLLIVVAGVVVAAGPQRLARRRYKMTDEGSPDRTE